MTGLHESAGGARTRSPCTVPTLVNLVNNAGFDPVVYRDRTPPARALPAPGDAAPLLRTAPPSARLRQH